MEVTALDEGTPGIPSGDRENADTKGKKETRSARRRVVVAPLRGEAHTPRLIMALIVTCSKVCKGSVEAIYGDTRNPSRGVAIFGCEPDAAVAGTGTFIRGDRAAAHVEVFLPQAALEGVVEEGGPDG